MALKLECEWCDNEVDTDDPETGKYWFEFWGYKALCNNCLTSLSNNITNKS